MNPFFEERLNIAHNLIDNRDFETAKEILTNLKVRIHDTDILTKINIHDSEVEKEYTARYQNLCTRGGDPTDSFKEVYILNKWRSQEYLKYYDKTFREHEI